MKNRRRSINLIVAPASLICFLIVLASAGVGQGQETDEMQAQYARMLRALKPTMIFEVAEQDINAYLATRPEELAIPEGFEDPKVTLRQGLLEISARKELVFISTRVRVGLSPQVVRGRLRLKVRSVHAGPIPLPSNFHAGISETIEGIINQILDRNELDLLRVEIVPPMVRVTAKVMTPEAAGDNGNAEAP